MKELGMSKEEIGAIMCLILRHKVVNYFERRKISKRSDDKYDCK